MKRFLLIIFQLSMLSVKAQTAYNLKNISVFNPSNTLIDFVKIDNQLYALLGYRPNDTSSGFKLYKANSNYDIEDSLIVIENKLQTYITNMVVNEDRTISLAITKHNDNQLNPTSILIFRIDEKLNILNRHVIYYRNFSVDIFTYANLIKLKNNNVFLNLILNKVYSDDEKCYNVYIICNTLNGLTKLYEDTLDLSNGKYKRFASFNQILFNDTIVIVRYTNNVTISRKYPSTSNGHRIIKFDSNLNIISLGTYSLNNPLTINNGFSTLFSLNNNLYLFGLINSHINYFYYNPNIIQILSNDSIKRITNIDTARGTSYRSVASNKSIVINQSSKRIFAASTYLTNNYLNWFGIICFNTNFDIIWNKYFKFNDSTEVFINGMIENNNELILYGWRFNFNDQIYRPLFLTITQDGWLTGENDVVVRTDLDATIYPNPANQKFTIQTNANVQSVQITDMQGKLIKTVGSNIDFNEIDIADLPRGMYVVQLQTPNGMLTKKLVVE
ncbi:MAG: T9SS type A sorting domain-containing protein [Bacteroidia bacterium]